MSVLTTFIIKKIQTWTEPKSGKDEPNRTVSSEPRVTDISVNRGNPTVRCLFFTVLSNMMNAHIAF